MAVQHTAARGGMGVGVGQRPAPLPYCPTDPQTHPCSLLHTSYGLLEHRRGPGHAPGLVAMARDDARWRTMARHPASDAVTSPAQPENTI